MSDGYSDMMYELERKFKPITDIADKVLKVETRHDVNDGVIYLRVTGKELLAAEVEKMYLERIDNVIKSLQSKHDAWLGQDGQLARDSFKGGLSWAISSIETLKL